MAFTGRLGTPSSKLSNIVLGISDELGKSIFDCQVHVLTSDQIRVSYTFEVTDTGIDPDNYILTSLADPPGSAILPTIESISWYDTTHRAVILHLSQPLTYNTYYSLESNGVYAKIDHEVISGFVRNFIASVQDPPQVIGAWMSKRGMIDIRFDRSVGPTSTGATFKIRKASVSPIWGLPITQETWATENLPEDTLRVNYTGSLPTTFNDLAIDFTDVTDASLNQVSGAVDVILTLRSTPPFVEADMLQLQLIEAFATDISSDLVRITTVRVFFNGPVLDANDTSKWTLTQDGSHVYPDTINLITAADATGTPSLLTLCADIKSQFNAHLIEPQVHTNNDTDNEITSTTPSNLSEAITMLQEAQTNYNAHVYSDDYHKWRDSVNIFTLTNISDASTAIAAANLIKASYNNHISATYPLSFSSYYPTPIGEITEYARYDVADRVFDVVDKYTYFADLHLTTESYTAPINIEATLTSEDSGSTTNPADYTGSIQARPIADVAQPLTHRVTPDSRIDLRFDKEIVIQPLDVVKVLDPSELEIPSEFEATSTWPTITWALNNLIVAYVVHIWPPVTPPVGAGHLSTDTVNTITIFDYAVLPESSILDAANDFRDKFVSHMTSPAYHYVPDEDTIEAAEATDLESLVKLVAELRRVFLLHNAKLGVHSHAGRRIVSAVLHDMLRCDVEYMTDGETHTIEGSIQHRYIDNGAAVNISGTNPEFIKFLNPIVLSHEFIGLATLPSLSSALPKNGLVINEAGIQFESDEVEVYFSKPMRQVPLDSSNLTISGGSIQQKESDWTNSSVVSIRVSNMEAILYTVVATGLTDLAGNPTY